MVPKPVLIGRWLMFRFGKVLKAAAVKGPRGGGELERGDETGWEGEKY